MKDLLAGLILFLTFLSCKTEREYNPELIHLIPSNSLYIIDTPEIGKFLDQTDTIDIFQKYSSFFTSDINKQLRVLTGFENDKAAIIAINQDEGENLNYVYITKEFPANFIIDSVKNKSLETLTYKNFVIQKYVLEELTFFKGEKHGVFIASNSRQQLEQILEKDYKGVSADTDFIKVYSAIDKGKTSIILNSTAFNDLITHSFRNIALPQMQPATWNVLEISSSNNAVSLNGISTWKEGEKNLISLFRNAGTQVNEIAKITPAEAHGFYSFTYLNIETLYGNLNSYRESTGDMPPDHFLHYTAEAGLISLDSEKKLPFLRATDPELAKELLLPINESNSFRGISIYTTPDNLNVFEYFTPLIPVLDLSYYIWIEDFIVFAENSGDLEQVVSSYLNNMTLGNQEYYTAAMENLAAASSLLIVSNNIGKVSSPRSTKSQPDNGSNPPYPVISFQFVVENNYSHIHGAFGLSGKYSRDITGQIASINLEESLATLAFPVKNHNNNQAEIIVQDISNILYLYSAAGSLIWKKQLSHQITGEITQVDLLKNGNLQYVFSTPYALHVLDRKGNPVKPFPLDFKEEITQPVSIFDYDNNRTYRFVLTQGNNILMYDARGRAVRGFDFDKVSSDIIQPPNHIRLNNKDYILVPESSGKLNILSRQGKSRIEVKKEIAFSASPWFPHKGNFVSISSDGKLVKVSENGNVTVEPLGENGNIRMAANVKVLAIMADNTLRINDRAVNLDYGLYTAPVIFTSGNKTYISITDTQAQRIYVFDENANLLPGFPLFGNSEIRLMNTGNNSIIFSVQGDDNEVIIYKL